MPAGLRPRRDPTDDWNQLRLLVSSPEQETYELLRPIVLFGQPVPDRARETGVPERTLRRQVARFDAFGMRSLFDALPATTPPTRPPTASARGNTRRDGVGKSARRQLGKEKSRRTRIPHPPITPILSSGTHFACCLGVRRSKKSSRDAW